MLASRSSVRSRWLLFRVPHTPRLEDTARRSHHRKPERDHRAQRHVHRVPRPHNHVMAHGVVQPDDDRRADRDVERERRRRQDRRDQRREHRKERRDPRGVARTLRPRHEQAEEECEEREGAGDRVQHKKGGDRFGDHIRVVALDAAVESL
jgi:hypothetical protein